VWSWRAWPKLHSAWNWSLVIFSVQKLMLQLVRGRYEMRDRIDLFFKDHKHVTVWVEGQKCFTYMRQNRAKWNNLEEFATETCIHSESRVSDIPTYSSVSLSLSFPRTSDTIQTTWHYHRALQILPLTLFALFREHDKSLTILSRLRAVRPGNPGSIARRDKSLALLQCPDLLWGTRT
jgi:hypothetical protein